MLGPWPSMALGNWPLHGTYPSSPIYSRRSGAVHDIQILRPASIGEAPDLVLQFELSLHFCAVRACSGLWRSLEGTDLPLSCKLSLHSDTMGACLVLDHRMRAFLPPLHTASMSGPSALSGALVLALSGEPAIKSRALEELWTF